MNLTMAEVRTAIDTLLEATGLSSSPVPERARKARVRATGHRAALEAMVDALFMELAARDATIAELRETVSDQKGRMELMECDMESIREDCSTDEDQYV